MIIVSQEKKFRFKNLCPYCGGNMTYQVTGCTKHPAKNFWKAEDIEGECDTEPDLDSGEWEDWFQNHSDMPYVYRLPIDIQVLRFINKKYRFRE